MTDGFTLAGRAATGLDIVSRFRFTLDMRFVLCFVLTLLPVAAQDASLVRESEPLTPDQERAKFKLPPGFSVQLVASEPVINKPMNLAFDAKGRLWATSSAEYPWAVKKALWKSPEGALESSKDKIVVFEDTNGDGLPDKSTIFADNLNIPTGVLPIANGCIAWSIPNIWKLEDTDGDGKCDKRTILFGPLGWEMDTHGMISSMRMGPDGWVYATHGFNNTSHFKVLPQNNPASVNRPQQPAPSAQNTGVPRSELDWGYSLDLHSGSVFRFKPDGSAVEPYTWGQVNPFGLCQDSYGSFYTADCHSNPITALIPGAFYQSFGKPHDGMGFAPVMCEHAHGSTGLCGVVYIDGGLWGPEWDDHMLVGNCVTSRINHDLVTFTGATPKANDKPDFLTTDDGWFRPVDLQIGPDGALYVADFYNRIIGHYEVPLTHPGRDRKRGRIWRIVKEGANRKRTVTAEAEAARRIRFGMEGGNPAKPTARTQQAQLEDVIVRGSATTEPPHSIDLGMAQLIFIPKLDSTTRHTVRLAFRSRLQQTGGFAALAGVKPSTTPEFASIIRTIQSPEASAWTLNYLLTQPQPNRDELRSTITALAKNLPGDGEAKLIGFVKQHFADDPGAQLELAGAIRQGIARRGGKPGAEAIAWLTQVAGHLFKELEQTPPVTTWDPVPNGDWIIQKRPCADGKEANVISSLGKKGEGFSGVIKSAPFLCPPAFAFYILGHRGSPSKPPTERNFARLVDAVSGAELIRAWPPRNDTAQRVRWDLKPYAGNQVRMELVDGDNNDSGEAYAWLAAGRFEPALISVPGKDPAAEDILVRTAAQMASELALAAHIPTLGKFLARAGLSAETRSTLASSLAGMNQPQAIAAVLKTAPASIQSVLGEVLAGTEAGAAALMECGVPRLLLQPVVAQKIAALKSTKLSERAAALTKDLPPESRETEALITARIQHHAAAAKDAETGHKVFITQCAICHKTGTEGNVVGPQLDGAGNRGIERLCEDILDPHRAVDPMFRMHIVTMKDGTIQAGLIRRDDAASLVLVNATGQETTLPKSSISKDDVSPLSLMPATFGLSIPEADFHHLLAWLESRRATAGK